MSVAKDVIHRLGFRRGSVPFGVRWEDDIVAIAKRPPDVVLDVGANIGQTAERIRRSFPKATVVSFEPVPSTFARLADNVRGIDGITAVNAAVGDAVRDTEITDTPLASYSGLNTIATTSRPDDPTVTVPMTTVDAYMETAGLDAIDVLKIDTEGYELPVLRGAQQALESGAIRFVLAECEFERSDVEPHGLFSELFDHLTPLGYHVVCFYCQGVFSTGWHWGDVLFMRPTEVRKTIQLVASPGMHFEKRVLNRRTDERTPAPGAR